MHKNIDKIFRNDYTEYNEIFHAVLDEMRASSKKMKYGESTSIRKEKGRKNEEICRNYFSAVYDTRMCERMGRSNFYNTDYT